MESKESLLWKLKVILILFNVVVAGFCVVIAKDLGYVLMFAVGEIAVFLFCVIYISIFKGK